MQLSLHLARLRCSKVASVDVVFSLPPHPSAHPSTRPECAAVRERVRVFFFTPQKSAQTLTSFGQRHFPFALMRRGGKGSTKTFAFFFFLLPPSLHRALQPLTIAAGFCKRKEEEGGEKKTQTQKSASVQPASFDRRLSAFSDRWSSECTTLNGGGAARAARVSLLTKPALLGWPKSDS